jgi:hypothetical protein
MSNIKFTDNSAAVKAQMQKNTGKALNVLGMEWQRLATGLADDRIYNTPISASGYLRQVKGMLEINPNHADILLLL